jgi:pimeloyl-ACP methyl ester carboxylesterase
VIARVHSERGAGPPLVYVPGIDGTGRLLFSTEERLARCFRVICLRYEPGSAEPREDSYERLAASVVAACRERVQGPVLLLSESFGGGVALQAALDHPQDVAGLAVVNSFARYGWRVLLAAGRVLCRLTPAVLFQIGRGRFAARTLFAPRYEEQAMQDFLAMQETCLDAAYCRRLRMIGRLDLLPRLAEISQPVALFASDGDRINPSVQSARAMAEALPNVELEILEQAGHVVLPLAEEPWVERRQELARRAGLEVSGDDYSDPSSPA